MEGNLAIPKDALAPVPQMLIADRLKYVVMNGERICWRKALIRKICRTVDIKCRHMALFVAAGKRITRDWRRRLDRSRNRKAQAPQEQQLKETSVPPRDPRQLTTGLSRAYGAYNGAVRVSVQPQVMGWVEIKILDGIEALALKDAKPKIAGLHKRLAELLADAQLMNSAPLREEFKAAYRDAEQIAFPAATAFVAQAQAFTDWTRNLNLMVADIARLRGLDRAAHADRSIRIMSMRSARSCRMSRRRPMSSATANSSKSTARRWSSSSCAPK